MQGIWTALLLKLIGYLTSAEFVNLVKELVFSLINDNDKTGEEKRTVVLGKIKESSFEFGTSLASLAIEGAVTLLKVKGPEALK